jgi:hypothetical protein
LQQFLGSVFSVWSTLAVASAGLAVAALGVFQRLTLEQGLAALTAIVSTLLAYLVSEKLQSAAEAEDARHVGEVRVYDSREQAYNRVASAINEVEGTSDARKEILHSSLLSPDLRLSGAPDDPALHAYEDNLKRCIRSQGQGSWKVKSLYTVATVQRLNEIVRWLEGLGDARGYEVKVVQAAGDVPRFSPLVIGERLVFLVREDPRYDHVESALELEGGETQGVVQRYFQELWQDRRAWHLRRENGLNHEAVAQLRRRLGATRDGSIDLTEPRSRHAAIPEREDD